MIHLFSTDEPNIVHEPKTMGGAPLGDCKVEKEMMEESCFILLKL